MRFSIFKDRAAICLDTSGEGLYKRGYRAVGVEAPLRETLAAAMVLLSRYRGKDPFCDPVLRFGDDPHRGGSSSRRTARPVLTAASTRRNGRFSPRASGMDAADEAMDQEFHDSYDIWGG